MTIPRTLNKSRVNQRVTQPCFLQNKPFVLDLESQDKGSTAPLLYRSREAGQLPSDTYTGEDDDPTPHASLCIQFMRRLVIASIKPGAAPSAVGAGTAWNTGRPSVVR